jgi:hypothetical protein
MIPENTDTPQKADCPSAPCSTILLSDCSTILLSDWKPDYRIQFHSRQNNEIGRLTWNDGVLRFTGNADESAKLFIQTMAAQLGMPFDLSNADVLARAGDKTPTKKQNE